MEEDIKILFNLIDVLNTGRCKFQENIRLDDCGYQEAIDNLIKRNRELEESNKILNDLYWNECIPKSKVKEKIEELKEILKHYGEYNKLNLLEKVNVDLIDAKIDVLQELMEE